VSRYDITVSDWCARGLLYHSHRMARLFSAALLIPLSACSNSTTNQLEQTFNNVGQRRNPPARSPWTKSGSAWSSKRKCPGTGIRCKLLTLDVDPRPCHHLHISNLIRTTGHEAAVTSERGMLASVYHTYSTLYTADEP
jgi:hypothetical protein